MAKYIDADRLRKEIEYLKALHIRHAAITKETNAVDGLDAVLQVIDSLQQEQPIQVNTLTWRDIDDLERIISNVHYEFRNGIGKESFGKEVLERFREERDEQEQPEVDLEKVLSGFIGRYAHENSGEYPSAIDIARYFYNLRLNARKEE